MSDWRLIETAPRDGTHFLAYWPDKGGDEAGVVCSVRYTPSSLLEKDTMEFTGGHLISFVRKDDWPTHWMPYEPPKP